MRDDRPDQSVADTSDPRYYAPEYKQGGDPGNFLIIDHGHDEFSMIAHFEAHSILVKTGDRVHQGKPLGKLGHSGDTSGPALPLSVAVESGLGKRRRLTIQVLQCR